jgi:hypothetical protein
MVAVYQMIGGAAILLGFAGTWLAARRPTGWLVGFTSAGLWIIPLAAGQQWVAIINCVVSMAICARNYAASTTPTRRSASHIHAAAPAHTRQEHHDVRLSPSSEANRHAAAIG